MVCIQKSVWGISSSLHLHFTYPSTARVVGAPQMTSQSESSIFLCSPLPSGTLQACPFPDIVFLSLLLPALSSSFFHCTLQDCLAWERCPYHCSLHLFTMLRRSSDHRKNLTAVPQEMCGGNATEATRETEGNLKHRGCVFSILTKFTGNCA